MYVFNVAQPHQIGSWQFFRPPSEHGALVEMGAVPVGPMMMPISPDDDEADGGK